MLFSHSTKTGTWLRVSAHLFPFSLLQSLCYLCLLVLFHAEVCPLTCAQSVICCHSSHHCTLSFLQKKSITFSYSQVCYIGCWSLVSWSELSKEFVFAFLAFYAKCIICSVLFGVLGVPLLGVSKLTITFGNLPFGSFCC